MIVLRKIQFETEQKITYGNESWEKEAKHIHTSAADWWCKCRHDKNEAREIDFLCCREVDAMLIAWAKIPEREGNISSFSFYGQLTDH